MQHIDLYSFHCGIIDCFCEMVHAGLKPLALSEPLPSAAECEAYLPFVETCTKKHHILFYLEPDSFVTDLFSFEKTKEKRIFCFTAIPLSFSRITKSNKESSSTLLPILTTPLHAVKLHFPSEHFSAIRLMALNVFLQKTNSRNPKGFGCLLLLWFT